MPKTQLNQTRPVQARRRARRLVVQALYQWQVSGQNLREIETQFCEAEDMGRADEGYFHELLHQIPAHLDDVDRLLGPALDRDIEAVDPVERAILRIGAYELNYRLEVPYRVVLNEAISLAKTFGSAESHKYVNTVLDRLAHELRQVEIGSEL